MKWYWGLLIGAVGGLMIGVLVALVIGGSTAGARISACQDSILVMSDVIQGRETEEMSVDEARELLNEYTPEYERCMGDLSFQG